MRAHREGCEMGIRWGDDKVKMGFMGKMGDINGDNGGK